MRIKNNLMLIGLLCTYLSSAHSVSVSDNKLAILENLVIDNFKQFCIENAGNFEKIIAQAKVKGYPEEENKYIALAPGGYRWAIYVDEKQNVRIRLILQNNTCAISAITITRDEPPSRESQTPIEHFLMNTMRATLVTRKQDEHYEERTFDAHYQDQAFTIILRNEIHPSQAATKTFFYQTILRAIPQ